MHKVKNSRFFRCLIIILLSDFLLGLVLPDLILCAAQQRADEIFLGPGDGIQVLVWDGRQIPKEGSYLSNFNKDYISDGRGYIRLSVLGEIQISGKSPAEIEKILTEKFMVFAKEPVVVVIPLIRVTLYGEFVRPGTYHVPPDLTFWQLVDYAGGPGEGCDFEKITVERRGEIVIQNFLLAFEEAHSLSAVGIRSGDQIYAPSKTNLTFKNIVEYFNFTAAVIMLYLSFQNYRARYR